MTRPYVNSYTESIQRAFEELDEENFIDQEKIVKSIVDKILEEVTDRVHCFISDYVISNLKDSFCAKAAEVAEHMLRDAIAGNDKQIRNLFDFNEWYMKHRYHGSQPKQWDLINAIVEKNPQIFIDERFTQKDKEIELWKDSYNRMKDDRDHLHTELAKARGHY
jgi:hypothetical protein